MGKAASEIFKQALSLPPEARAALADSLLDSLDTEVDEEAAEKWREEILLGEARPLIVADLGHGVLDAMVETAAYTLEKVG